MTVMNISRGQRIKLTDIISNGNEFQLGIACNSPGLVVDFSCFGLDASEKLSDDRYMTFFNQPATPCGGVSLSPPTGDSAGFAITLQKLPTIIHHLIITAAIDGSGTMSQLKNGYVRFLSKGTEVARFDFKGADFSAERALMLLDIYRKDNIWRISAVGQGFNGGLDALVKHFGGCVDEMTPSLPSPHPSDTLSSQSKIKTALSVFHDRLRDGSNGPTMITIPAGEFWMGSPENEAERESRERNHWVEIEQPFAIGQYAVTFEEYDRFCDAQRKTRPEDKGWGRGNLPVINVSWVDALDYTEWLSAQTGQNYRLPTEAEWEYAARAGTETAFWWGDDASRNQANYGRLYGKTLPVDRFQPNPWGLYQVHGNVLEWTGSQYDQGYSGAEMLCADQRYMRPFVGAGRLLGQHSRVGAFRLPRLERSCQPRRRPGIPSRQILITLCSLSFYHLPLVAILLSRFQFKTGHVLAVTYCFIATKA
ncbi:MAG: SUMF1/EgtB/PvdO family nonheme iron enzyme [Candidatus Competibacteraceae bacterium]